MRKTYWLAVACLLGLGIVGCAQEKDSNAPATNSSSSSANESKSDSNAANSDTNTAEAVPQGMSLDKIPAELKKDAFDYYGLGRPAPVKMNVVTGSDRQPATQTIILDRVEDGHADFTVKNEGALAQLGDVKLRLDKKGVRIMSIGGVEAAPDTYELVNGLTKGKAWEAKMKTASATISSRNVVSGTEDVTTPVGTYKDALVITVTGSGLQGKQKFQMTSKVWLVKGRGQVKAEDTNVEGSNKTTYTIEESK
ncbi:MAG: hypothetical protein JST12_05110 [Armatimonadetes bacterium]|nr:hypothetical protein [Armatimonadota bacterium]